VDGESGIETTRRVARIFSGYGIRVAATLLWLQSVPAAADFIVPANSVVSLNGGTLDLGCTDLIVAGILQVGSGKVLNARNVMVQPGGAFNGGSGVIEVGGNWLGNGGFVAGSGTVRFRDLCAIASATISGNSSFANARFVSSIGKNYVFAVGSTQTITGVLEITGTAPQPIQFRSSIPGQVAFINLTGSGNINHQKCSIRSKSVSDILQYDGRLRLVMNGVKGSDEVELGRCLQSCHIFNFKVGIG